MVKTRCKVVCTETRTAVHGKGGDKMYYAKLEGVTNGSAENDTFFRYTPSAKLELGILTKQHFEEGKEYYLDFTEAE